MRYVVRENPDPRKKYATHLRPDGEGRKIIWDASPKQDVLVVQTSYNHNALRSIESICRAMDGMALPHDRYMEIMSMPGTWVHFTSSLDYAKSGGCAMRVKACTYTIFCCEVHKDECVVYSQDAEQANNLPYRNIKLEIPVQVQKMTTVEGLFFNKREVDTGFYQINLPAEYAETVDDGDLYYTVASAQHLEIPITREMFKHGSIYIKTYDKPLVASHNSGLAITQR